MKTRGSIATLAVLWALGCTGKVTVYEVIVNGRRSIDRTARRKPPPYPATVAGDGV